MAKPKIFISSTFYDLKHVREDISHFVKEQGYDPILFEKGEIPYGRNERPEEYCYVEINNSDILVSIIGGRYGTDSSDIGYSITQKELKSALEQNKQVYIFIEKNVLAEYETYKINKDVEGIQFRHADDRKVYEFLDEIYQLPRNNPIFGFESSQEIIKFLRDQWAGLFQRLLKNEEDTSQIEIIKSLKGTVSTLKDMINIITEKSENQGAAFNEIILFNHPLFARIKEVLNINYRVSFLDYTEMEQLFLARQFKLSVNQDPFAEFANEYYVFFNNLNKSNDIYIKVSKDLFDENKKLKPQQGVIEKNCVIREELIKVLNFSDDDLPF
ncbi:DUF4062 domain-containing protein [Metasolibacillus meyeri]|uniref:DUF4062 domain-containing protein n=1 Tax=Metasolibacillus meyeri TaxID=1071052 RepID=A0AAW9NIF9_9BACL|nr:DUF4062 domain-containing protein [Metasolibacillus meyeri]MEC1178444.1 DUF4062 domain-containing protein [Metasolibacillus meyeri]